MPADRYVLLAALAVACSPSSSDRAKSSTPSPPCTSEAVRVYAAAIPALDLATMQSAADGLLRLVHMDQCSRQLLDLNLTMDAEHSRQLERFIDRFGWPGPGVWSLEVRKAAFLLAQHSPDLELQQRVLAALAPLIKKDTEAAQQHAYLYDRVHAVRLRSYQRFGTQGQCVARGQWSPLPIENPEQVDERRRQIGLPPLSEYIVMMNGVCAKHDLGGAPLPGQPQIPDALRLVE